MRDTVASGEWLPAAIHRRPIAVPHFGSVNNLIAASATVFLMPFTEVEQDAFLQYEWMYVESACGPSSVELARCVYANKDHQPMLRFTETAGGLQSRRTYLRCLLRWNYVRMTDAVAEGWVWRPKSQHEKQQLTNEQVNALMK